MDAPRRLGDDELYACILAADLRSATKLLRAEAGRFGAGHVLSDLIHPTLAKVGDRFLSDNLSLAQVYMAGKMVEDFLAYLEGSNERLPVGEGRRVAVIGNAEDDYHAVGRRMVGAFLKMAGWKVLDLGNDVLPARFLDVAEAEGASVIGVSAMMLTNALNIASVRHEIEKRGLAARIRLAVGGAIFILRPELVAEVGGDGTAATALDAPALFERLLADTGSPA